MMVKFTDNYKHCEPEVIYVDENIAGTTSILDEEYECIKQNYDSQLTPHCECSGLCTVHNNCSCVTKYGSDNYSSSLCNGSTIQLLNTAKINRPVFECNSLCACKTQCGNRLVQYGPKLHLEIKMTTKGLGLFTTISIPRGAFICEYAGEVISKAEAEIRHAKNKRKGKMNYIFNLKEHCGDKVINTIVDPSLFGNIGRYINHSCQPNCAIIAVRIDSPIPKLSVFSVMDIEMNSEITFDYGPSNANSDSDEFRTKCLCLSEKCRKWLPFEDL